MSDRVPSEDPVLRIVLAAKGYIVGGERGLQAIKTPYTIYEAAVASVRTNINEVFMRLPSASGPSDASRLQDDIVKYGGELKELENQYKANLRDKEAAYEEQRRSVLEKLCRNLVTTLGLPLVESTVIQDLSNRESSGGLCWCFVRRRLRLYLAQKTLHPRIPFSCGQAGPQGANPWLRRPQTGRHDPKSHANKVWDSHGPYPVNPPMRSGSAKTAWFRGCDSTKALSELAAERLARK